MNEEISVELTGWNREEQIFDFDVYRAGTDEVLASYQKRRRAPRFSHGDGQAVSRLRVSVGAAQFPRVF